MAILLRVFHFQNRNDLMHRKDLLSLTADTHRQGLSHFILLANVEETDRGNEEAA